MAINDYFLYLLPEGVNPVQTVGHGTVYEGQSKLRPEELQIALNVLKKKVVGHVWAGRKSFLVDNNLIFSPNVENGKIVEIMVQGSLSWFPEGLADIYKVGQELAKAVPITFYLHNDLAIETNSEKKFLDAMLVRYGQKLAEFKAKYGDKKLKVDADSFFRHTGRGWSNLFGFFGRRS